MSPDYIVTPVINTFIRKINLVNTEEPYIRKTTYHSTIISLLIIIREVL